MSDEQNRKAILANTKAINSLTAKFKAGKSAERDDEAKEKGEVTGVKAVDKKIEDIKDAFNNNTTVKFFKDPAGTIGGGLKKAFDPILSIPENIGNSFKKIGGFFGKFAGGSNKTDKKTVELLTSLNKTQVAMNKTLGDMAIAMGVRTGMAIAQNEEVVKAVEGIDVAGPIKKLSELRGKSAAAIKGFFMKKLGVDFLFKKINEKFFDKSSKEGEKQRSILDGIKEFGYETQFQLLKISDFFNNKFSDIISAAGVQPDMASNEHVLEAKDIGQSTARALERSESKKDQAESEARKDQRLFQTQQNETLLGGLLGGLRMLSFRNIKDAAGSVTGGLIGFIKKNILGIGAGAAVAGGKIGVGIAGFFKGIGSGFMYLGANLPMFAKGAAAMALLGLSFLPFAGVLMILNNALEGFTLEKVGIFALTLVTMGAAVAAFTASVAFLGPLVFLGIAALAAAGAALIPFGYAIKLAGEGLEKTGDLFGQLSTVNWDTIGMAGKAIKDIAGAMGDIAFGGLFSRVFDTGFHGFVKDLSAMGAASNSVVAAAGAINLLADSITNLMSAVGNDLKALDFLEGVQKSAEEMEGGLFGSGFFGTNMNKAADGLGAFLGKMTEHINYNQNRGGVIDSMSNLLDSTVGAATFFADPTNQSANFTGMVDPALSAGMNMPVVVNQGSDNSVVGGNTYITTDMHADKKLISHLVNFRGAQ